MKIIILQIKAKTKTHNIAHYVMNKQEMINKHKLQYHK